MARTYSARTLTLGSKGKAQVTLIHNGQSITRHLVNMVGKHPDPAIPARHQVAQDRITQATSLLAKLEKTAAEYAKMVTTGVFPKGIDPAEVQAWLGACPDQRVALEAHLEVLAAELAELEANDPILVTYLPPIGG